MILLKIIQLFFQQLSFINKKWAAKLGIELLFRPRRTKRGTSEEKFWQSGTEIIFNSGCIGRTFGGDLKSGKKIICIVHGWQSQASRFRKLISHFTDLNYVVLTWNGPGHGESPGNRTNLAAFSRILFTDLNELHSPIYALIGHSFGAAACAFICRQKLNVEKLILIAGPGSAYGVFERYWDFIKLGKPARPLFIEFVESEVKLKVDDMSVEKYIHELTQKILIVHDKGDQVVPYSDIERLQKIAPDAVYFTTENLGHHRIVSDENVKINIDQFIHDVIHGEKSDVQLSIG